LIQLTSMSLSGNGRGDHMINWQLTTWFPFRGEGMDLHCLIWGLRPISGWRMLS
jgi:hypothetical protein